MKTSLLFIAFSFCCCALFAQTRNPAVDINRANIWHIGSESTINDAPSIHFGSGTPVVVNVGRGGVSTLSDTLGNLEVYGGNFDAYNRLHSQMKNSGFIGDSGWIGILQTAIAVPKPKHPNIIYYFTTSVLLRYNEIDMLGDGGNGEFIKRNDTLRTNVGVKLAAVHHCNGSDVWVTVHEQNTNRFFTYLVTENGVNDVPVINEIGPLDNEQGFVEQGGSMKFSPNGKKLAITFSGLVTIPHVFDFDNSTGTLTNPVPLKKDTGELGISFSPDNNLLYIGSLDGRLLQYNLLAGDSIDIKMSRKVIHDVFVMGPPLFGFKYLQLARDGKIYVQQGGSSFGNRQLGVINSPNALDTFCNYTPSGLYLNGAWAVGDGMMNTVESFFYTGSSAFPCYGDTATVDCDDNSVCTIDSYHVATGCIYIPVNCDDNDSCTIDACDSLAGCFYIPDTNCINGVSEMRSKFNVLVSPNPFANDAFIRISSVKPFTGRAEYFLHDASGRETALQLTAISQNPDEIQAILFRANLKPGLYFLTIRIAGNAATTKISIF